MERVPLVKKFRGYINKADITNVPAGFLTVGSQNVVSNDGEKVGIRKGYTLDGAANSANNGIEGSFEWLTSRGLEIPLRSYDDELEYRYSGTWYRLADSWGAVDFQFDTYWDPSALQDKLLFVNGSTNIYEWSGGITTFASATSNTITKEGSTTWAAEGFTATGTVIIDGIEYAYTGGTGTTTLTGVSGNDPSAGGHTAGDVVVQKIVTTANSSITSLPPAFTNDLIGVLNNQIYIGSLTSRFVYVSKQDNYTDFSSSTPRLIGEGQILTLDSTVKAFVVNDETMYISGGLSDWYKINFVISDDLQNETLIIRKLNNDPQEGALSQSSVGKIKNHIVFVNNEPALQMLGQVENVSTPQSRNLSDPIKNDFDSFDFTLAHVRYYRNNLYIALPAESVMLIYNIEKGFWEPPQILPAGRIAIYGGNLYLHSNSVPETYKLFNGTNDNATAINAIAAFSYINGGRRERKINFDQWYTEGYIAGNTELQVNILYDYLGASGENEYDIDGSTTNDYVYSVSSGGSIGKFSLGKTSIGGRAENLVDVSGNKFRHVKHITPKPNHEVQVVYSSNDIDFTWELLAFGGNYKMSKESNQFISE